LRRRRLRPGVEQATVRHLTLKDTQILANDELQTQQDPTFCGAPITNPAATLPRGSCAAASPNTGNWLHTVSGQVYPHIDVGPKGDVWEILNASGNRSYKLSIGDPAAKPAVSPIPMQILAIDGVTINVANTTTQAELAVLLANKMTVVPCPEASSVTSSLPVCATEIRMMPSSRVAVRVIRQDDDATPANLQLYTALYGTGPLGVAGDQWPGIALASVSLDRHDPATPRAVALKNVAATTVASSGHLQSPPVVRQPGATKVTTNVRMQPPDGTPVVSIVKNCPALAPGHHRRIKFGYPTSTTFGLGFDVVDAAGNVVGSQQPIEPFSPTEINVCVPVEDEGNTHEMWELLNYTPEDHNFHIHQTRFFLVSGGVEPGTSIPKLLNGNLVSHDNVPMLRSSTPGCDGVVGSKLCSPTSTFVVIPFRELGDFVLHCHILEHEDGGMMGRIHVQPAP